MKPKLLVILNRLVIGGQAFDTIPLLHKLRDSFDILVLYGCREKDEVEASFLFEKYPNITLQRLTTFRRSFNPLRDARTFFSVLRTIRHYKPAIVHTHGLKSGLLGRTAAYLKGVPCIIHTFHGHHFHSYFNRFVSGALVRYERLMSRITTKIIAISPAQMQELAVVYKIAHADKIAVIPLGVDEASFFDDGGSKRLNFRQKYGLLPGQAAIGIVGRVVPIKNYDLFVKVAAGILAAAKAHVKFFVIGDGHETPYVQAEFTRLGIEWCTEGSHNPAATVVFTSWVDDVSTAMHGLDIVVLTSHNEGTPLSLIEAQFCGKPVVSTDVGGVKDTFINNETGFLAPPSDSGIFIQKLQTLVLDEGLRNAMGKKAAEFARARFSKANETNSFRALYLGCNKA